VERLDETGRDAQEQLTRQRLRISQLDGERDKLLQAYYAGAIQLDQLKREQTRISQGLADAERVLKANESDLTETRVRLDQALDLVEDCQAAYRQADDSVRRLMNQTFFVRLLVDDDGVRGELAEPFSTLVGLRAVEAAEDRGLTMVNGRRASNALGTTKPSDAGAHEGLSIDWLVGEGGLEPPHPFGHRNLNPARLPIPPLARVERSD
jgi:site-specific DNA recombinase